MARKLKRSELIDRLEPLAYAKDEDLGQDPLEQMNLSRVLLLLAKIDPESIYSVCRSVTKHLLGHVPDPELADAGPE